MKIVVIGGTGLIGSKLVNKLREHGHEADHPRSFLFPAAVRIGARFLVCHAAVWICCSPGEYAILACAR